MGTGPLCDALALLQAKCQSCHRSKPLAGVPMPLVTYADLVAPSPSDPTKTTVQACIDRMQDTVSPMPPAPAAAATASDVAILQAWVDAGEPSTCDSGTGGTSGTSGTAGAAGAPPDPYNTPVVCTSNTNWTRGNEDSPNMRPGGACISCHASTGGEAPTFAFAGTVYPTAHEPDDCNGVNGSSTATQVVITDANGTTFTLNVNSVGNFSYTAKTAVALPYHAKVVSNGKELVMPDAQQSGDCNSCHTESGSMNAPGRIMAP
jgi:hypothetical protein